MLLTFRRWRRGRPFWGGLTTVVAGVEIAAIPLAPLRVMVLQGVTGFVSVLMGLVLVLMGLSAWFAPYYRGLAGVLAVLVAAGALVLSNLGGFFVGTIVGVLGGSLVFAWQPLPPPEAPRPPPTQPEGIGTPAPRDATTSGTAPTERTAHPRGADQRRAGGDDITATVPEVVDRQRTTGVRDTTVDPSA
ncbi:DUF6114 domain-containing protein [Streptomyces sp. NPDC057702]|uniref:DUF6114 domain-containing protein n=1 Tax=unclassified Streptomyces TaxID=2593676 RepID=UPI0036AA2A6A